MIAYVRIGQGRGKEESELIALKGKEHGFCIRLTKKTEELLFIRTKKERK